MEELSASEIDSVAGGEVGATGMGDDYHYTGEADFWSCYVGGISGGRSVFDMNLVWSCL